jgi:hypothetical protein
MAREHSLWIARQMGHRDVSITLKVYAKYIPAMNPDAGMAAWRAVSNRGLIVTQHKGPEGTLRGYAV